MGATRREPVGERSRFKPFWVTVLLGFSHSFGHNGESFVDADAQAFPRLFHLPERHALDWYVELACVDEPDQLASGGQIRARLKIDNRVRPKVLSALQLLRVAASRDDTTSALEFRRLDRQLADETCRSQHQDCLTWGQMRLPFQREPCGKPRVAQRGSHRIVNTFRYLDETLLVYQGPLRH